MNLSEIPKLVINLPTRVERLEGFFEQFKYISQGEGITVIPGVIDASPRLGIAKAHINAISHAKENKWPSVMIFEDDVLFQAKNKTIEYVQNCLFNIPENWNVLLGGVYEGRVKPYSDYWDSIGQFCGLHCYIVNEKFYDKFLSYNEKHHIDRWVNFSGSNNVYVTKKFFAIQKPGYSDNVKKDTDYSVKLKGYKLL